MSSKMSRDLQRTGNRVSRNVSIALRAERIIARRRFAVARTQTGLVAFAGLVAGIGVVMLNVAAFFWLATSLGNAAAGGIIAVFNFALAGILALVASRMTAEKELEPMIEMRDLAIEDIETEVGDALTEARDLAENIRRIARDPFGAAIPGMLGPLLALLLKTLKK